MDAAETVPARAVALDRVRDKARGRVQDGTVILPGRKPCPAGAGRQAGTELRAVGPVVSELQPLETDREQVLLHARPVDVVVVAAEAQPVLLAVREVNLLRLVRQHASVSARNTRI